jgi:hypothetical protein
MRPLMLVLGGALAMAAGCSGSGWKKCEVLRVYSVDVREADFGLTDGRYRVVSTKPLTIEYEGTAWPARVRTSGVQIVERVSCDPEE